MKTLNLPHFEFKFKSKENKRFIFDTIRKKYVALSHEEWVRQHFVQYLIQEKKYPVSLISIEKKIVLNHLTKRIDILVFNNTGKVEIIIECKSPKIKIKQQTFDQLARYNTNLKARLLIVTNGLEHYYYTINETEKKYEFLTSIPNYK